MSDIHPENLLEKFAAGALTPKEHELLHEHLAACVACRFELLVRADLETEADALEFDHVSTRQLLSTLPEARTLPGAPLLAAALGSQHQPARVPLQPSFIGRPRRPLRRAIAVTAAALGLASAAAALVAIQVPETSRTLDVALRAPVSPKSHGTPASLGTRQRSEAVPAEPATPSTEAAPEAPPVAKTRAASEPAPEAPRPAHRSSAPKAPTDDALTAAQLFSEANEARRSSNPARATQLYRLLQRKFPTSREAQLSLVTLGSLQLNGGNAAGALATFNRYLRTGGRSLEAEALYGQAQALRRLGRSAEERRSWERLLARYPGSGYAPQARERLDSLGGS